MAFCFSLNLDPCSGLLDIKQQKHFFSHCCHFIFIIFCGLLGYCTVLSCDGYIPTLQRNMLCPSSEVRPVLKIEAK